jgi:hypothetical protein
MAISKPVINHGRWLITGCRGRLIGNFLNDCCTIITEMAENYGKNKTIDSTTPFPLFHQV